jgi:hypothetical protein
MKGLHRKARRGLVSGETESDVLVSNEGEGK